MNRVELPCGDHRDDAGRQLDLRDLARRTPLPPDAAHLPTMQRVPAIMDHHVLPDMGRMTPRLFL